jgi:hypothetical protein
LRNGRKLLAYSPVPGSGLQEGVMSQQTDLLYAVLALQMNFIPLINLMAFGQTDQPDRIGRA